MHKLDPIVRTAQDSYAESQSPYVPERDEDDGVCFYGGKMCTDCGKCSLDLDNIIGDDAPPWV
jgi:hypothetical protein